MRKERDIEDRLLSVLGLYDPRSEDRFIKTPWGVSFQKGTGESVNDVIKEAIQVIKSLRREIEITYEDQAGEDI